MTGGHAAAPAGPLRVVLVDDHEMVLGTASRRCWRPSADRVEWSATRRRRGGAASVVDGIAPDVVLCDVRMQGDSGLDLCRRLRERRPEPRVVMLTVYDDEQYLFQALRAGAAGYLLKRVERRGAGRATSSGCAPARW